MNEKEKNIVQKGIAVIIIIVLLILAGVTIKMAMNSEGLFTEAEQSNGIETGVKVKEIYDENGKDETVEGYDPNKLHIGDFVNYSAGSWESEGEIQAVQVGKNDSLVTASTGTTLPTIGYQFGGFGVGASRDGNVSQFNRLYTYVNGSTENGTEQAVQAVTGWRVFDIEEDGSIILISAGCPEYYYHPFGPNNAYISEYILSRNINSNASSLNLETEYMPRDWSMYVNQVQGATSATALTRQKLDQWYVEHMNIAGADTGTDATYQSIKGTKYESLIDNHLYYWLASANRSYDVYSVYPNFRHVTYDGHKAFGVRVLVSLDPNVKLSNQAVGTKTLTSQGGDYTYNVWDLIM